MTRYLSVGQGKRDPHATVISVESLAVGDLKRVLEECPLEKEGWWSPHLWCASDACTAAPCESHRGKKQWISSSIIALDLDWKSDGARHGEASPPDDTRSALEQLAREGRLPCSLFHHTPHGARTILVLDRVAEDPEQYLSAARRCAQLTVEALAGDDLGFFVDETASLDLARLLYRPRCEVHSRHRDRWETRDWPLLLIREELFELEALAAQGANLGESRGAGDTATAAPSRSPDVWELPSGTYRLVQRGRDDRIALSLVRSGVEIHRDRLDPNSAIARTRFAKRSAGGDGDFARQVEKDLLFLAGRTQCPQEAADSTEYSDAAARYNSEHVIDWNKFGRTCPFCEHNDCFGPMPDDSARWYCFSDQHEEDSGGVGVRGEKGWHGDALDLDAHKTGQARDELLAKEGYLFAEDDERSPPDSEKLVQLVEDAEFFHDTSRELYVTISVGDHSETWPVTSEEFRMILSALFRTSEGNPPAIKAIYTALEALKYKALFEGPCKPVFVRSGHYGPSTFIDLADHDWSLVEILAGRWRIGHEPQIKFLRRRGMLAMPCPESGGKLDELQRFVNCTEEQWPLLLAFLIAASYARGPFPVLCIHGEQGSAKTFTARVIRHLLDPNAVPLRAPPREERDLVIAARNNKLLCFDNVSAMPGWLSDALCRVSSGSGFGTRRLYTDSDEAVFSGARPIVLNGIEDLAWRPDLLDRSIVLHLPMIPDEHRATESRLWSEFIEASPRLLGALLDGLAATTARLPKVRVAQSSRMADFVRKGVAAEEALDRPPGSFLRAYSRNRAEGQQLAVEESLLARTVQKLVKAEGRWEGTATELLKALEKHTEEIDRRDLKWPGSPSALSGKLRRLAPVLRPCGISIDLGRSNQGSHIVLDEDLTESSEPNGGCSPCA